MSRKNTRWTNRQIARLRECYSVMPMDELIREFAPHPLNSIQNMAQKMKFARPNRKWLTIAQNYKPVIFTGRVVG